MPDAEVGVRLKSNPGREFPNRVWQSLAKYDLRSMLAKITVPVLVVEGAESIVPFDSTLAYAEAAPNARALLLPNTHHMVFLDSRDAFFRAADTFFRGTWPEGASVVDASPE